MTVSDDDKELFRAAMSDVHPLKSNNTSKHKSPQGKIIKTIIINNIQDKYRALEEDQWAPQVDPEASLFYTRGGINKKQLNDLKQAKLSIDRCLDLHGKSIEIAHDSLAILLANAINNNDRVIKLIHGKGKLGILKNQVNRWLRAHPAVLAFCSTPPAHGGTGAVLVLLKR